MLATATATATAAAAAADTSLADGAFAPAGSMTGSLYSGFERMQWCPLECTVLASRLGWPNVRELVNDANNMRYDAPAEPTARVTPTIVAAKPMSASFSGPPQSALGLLPLAAAGLGYLRRRLRMAA